MGPSLTGWSLSLSCAASPRCPPSSCSSTSLQRFTRQQDDVQRLLLQLALLLSGSSLPTLAGGRPVRASRQGAGLPRSNSDHPQEHRLGGISNPAPPWVGRGPTGWSTPAKANSDLMLAECTPGIQHHICPQPLGLHHIPSDKDNGKSKLAQKS